MLLTAATFAGCGEGTPPPSAAPTQAAVAKVSHAPTVQANPASVEDYLDVVHADVISGWAMDSTKPASPVTIELYDGDALLASVEAREFRQDLLDARKGDGYHGFTIPTPAPLKDGQPHTVHAKCAGGELKNSPQTIPKG